MLRKIIFICKMFWIKIPLNVTNVNNNPITYNKMIWNCSVQEEKEKLTFDLYFGFWKF